MWKVKRHCYPIHNWHFCWPHPILERIQMMKVNSRWFADKKYTHFDGQHRVHQQTKCRPLRSLVSHNLFTPSVRPVLNRYINGLIFAMKRIRPVNKNYTTPNLEGLARRRFTGSEPFKCYQTLVWKVERSLLSHSHLTFLMTPSHF